MRQPLSVRQILKTSLPVTASLVIGGTVLFLLLAFPIGLLSALRPRSLLDKGLMVGLLIGVSAHPVFLGLTLSYFLGFKWHVTPIAGLLQPALPSERSLRPGRGTGPTT
jgi:peptide/nickel transport system permease protein